MYRLTYTTEITLDNKKIVKNKNVEYYNTLREAYLEAEKQDLWNSSGTNLAVHGIAITELSETDINILNQKR